MDVIGRIPDDLSGVYIRNTENPLFEPIQRYHPFDGDAMLHAMAFTENYAILNDLPLFWDPASLAEGYYSNTYRRDMPSRFAILPRMGTTEDIVWFEANPTFVLHWINAYEDGDEIILDGFFQHNPTGKRRDSAPEKKDRKGLGRMGLSVSRYL